MSTYILSIDQGTTSSRALAFGTDGKIAHVAQQELPQHYPANGWVEHDAGRILSDTLATAKQVIDATGADNIAAIGITNQRETSVIWNTETGEPLGNAIVWQDRRTADYCAQLKADGVESEVSKRTGLLLDPYFSGTKLKWMLDNLSGARALADAGKLAFGTIDCWLIWCLTGGRVHATDASNAARTMLYNIHTGDWDDHLLSLFGIPRSILPDVKDSSGDFGTTHDAVLGHRIAIRGVAGDQQSATFGQAALQVGDMKATFGTGCFALLNTGDTAVTSDNRLLTTIAWQLDGKVTYALEGSVFVAGAAIQWLRDGLKIISSAPESEALATEANPDSAVYMVPAFTGLGAPYWDPDARGALLGLTRDTGPAEIASAALKSVCYQSRDLVDAMARDMAAAGAGAPGQLRVDGGFTANNLAMQFLADLIGMPVDRPVNLETTAAGAAMLAGLAAGVIPDITALAAMRQTDQVFNRLASAQQMDEAYDGWQQAVARIRTDQD